MVLNCFTVFTGSGIPHVRSSKVIDTLRDQVGGTASRLAQSVHNYLPATLLSLLVPSIIPLYTALDNISKSGNNAVGFFPVAVVEWMQAPENRNQRRRRTRISLSICFGVVISIPIVWSLVGPSLMEYFYQQKIVVPFYGVLLLGVTVALFLLVYTMELLVLVPAHRERWVYRVELLGSLLGIVLVIPMSVFWGAVGAFGSYSIAYLAKLLFFALLARRFTWHEMD